MEKKLKRNLSTSKDKDATRRVHFAFNNIKARPALLSNISQGQRQNCRNCVRFVRRRALTKPWDAFGREQSGTAVQENLRI